MNSRVDFAILTAKTLELEAVLGQVEACDKEKVSGDNHIYYRGRIPARYYSSFYDVVVVTLRHQGTKEASATTTQLINTWKPRYILLVGIAGGIHQDDLTLGDVVVSDLVYDYEFVKVGATESVRPRMTPPSAELLSVVHSIFLDDSWAKSIKYPRPPNPTRDTPKHFVGPVGSGDKLWANKAAQKQLLIHCPKMLAVEMEAAGFVPAVEGSNLRPNWLVIRGISDMADRKKSDKWQPYAATAAAVFAQTLISESLIKPYKLQEATTESGYHPSQIRPRTKQSKHFQVIPYSLYPYEEQNERVLRDLQQTIGKLGGSICDVEGNAEHEMLKRAIPNLIGPKRIVIPVHNDIYVWRLILLRECSSKMEIWAHISHTWQYEHGVLFVVTGSVANRAFPPAIYPPAMPQHSPTDWGWFTVYRLPSARAFIPYLRQPYPENSTELSFIGFTLPRIKDPEVMTSKFAKLSEFIRGNQDNYERMRTSRESVNSNLARWIHEGWLFPKDNIFYMLGAKPSKLGKNEKFVHNHVSVFKRDKYLLQTAKQILALQKGITGKIVNGSERHRRKSE